MQPNAVIAFSPKESKEAEDSRGCSGQHETADGRAVSLRDAVQSAPAARPRPQGHEGAARRLAAGTAAEARL